MIFIVFLLIVLYGLLGLMFLLIRDMWTDNYDTPDFGDLFTGKMEPEEQNKIVLFVTFWPIIVFFYLVKFIFNVAKAVYKAIVWYVKGFISSKNEKEKK